MLTPPPLGHGGCNLAIATMSGVCTLARAAARGSGSGISRSDVDGEEQAVG